jgi:glycosyltransferase involved in cell wall biosynthesis
VHIVRLPQLPDHSKSALRRIAYYTSFMLSAMTLGHLRFDKCDAVLVYEAAVVTGLAGWVLARMHGVPLTLYTVDLWPESVTSTGMLKNRTALRILEWLCGFIYRRADCCVGITKGYVKRFIEMGVKPEKTDLVYYWSPSSTAALPADFDIEAVMPAEARFRVLYAGNMGPAQDLGCVLGAAAILRDKAPNVEFVMAGGGVDYEALCQRAKDEKLTNVRFVGSLPPQAMPVVYQRADALLVHLKPDTLTRVSIPSKTLSYMQARKPIIMAVEGEAGEFVREHGCGLSVAPSQPKELADSVLKLLAMSAHEREAMGRKGVEAYDRECSPKVMGAKLCSIVEKLAEGGKRSC